MTPYETLLVCVCSLIWLFFLFVKHEQEFVSSRLNQCAGRFGLLEFLLLISYL